MKTLENIQDLKKLLLNPYTIYTYDYADGFIINDTTDYIEIYEIEIEDESLTSSLVVLLPMLQRMTYSKT